MADAGPPEHFEAQGVIHCHSTYSDGMEPIGSMVEAAARAGLDYLMVTDHNTLAPLQDVGEQWIGNTLLLLGCEITPRRNHLLAYGLTRLISPQLTPPEFTAEAAKQGGLSFLAHPYELGSQYLRFDTHIWEDWSVTEHTGIEIWNYFSQWVGSCQSLWATLRSLASWRWAVRGPYGATLAKWDEQGQRRRVTGIGGVDAHGAKRRILGWDLVFHPYQRAFCTIRTHLLLAAPFSRNLDADRILVTDALREGACFVANHEEGDPAGFTFIGRREDDWLTMGQEVTVQQPGTVWLSVHVPVYQGSPPALRLIKDGLIMKETAGSELQVADTGPGVYRVEVWRDDRGWIFSNPIYLRSGTRRVARG